MMATLDKVIEIIRDKLNLDAGKEVKLESSFTEDLGADSLDTVELVMEFEKEFNVQIPDDAAEKIATVGDAVKFIDDNKK
ncbi:MAG: acyl carrier protein [Alphaproteobacteria bacterium]|nr:acyl carrier protein [Alphaproteobacteria bacterium]MBN2779875.1 acyl carrier protein [Alphaproteobacteria bacterium]